MLFLLLNAVHQMVLANETIPFSSISEVRKFNILTTAIASDNEVVWIGSLNGLVMVRPGERVIFNTASGHLKSNHISDISVNDRGDVWATSFGDGVFYYNHKDGESYSFKEKFKLEDLICNGVTLNKNESELFIACDESVHKMILDTEELIRLEIFDADRNNLKNVFFIFIDDAGGMIIGTWGNGLFYLEKQGEVAKHLGLKNGFITDIEELEDNHYVISSDTGAYLLSMHDFKLIKLFSNIKSGIPVLDVIETSSLNNNSILVALESHGLHEFDVANGTLDKPKLLSPMLEHETIGIINQVETLNDGLLLGIGADNTGFYVVPARFGFTSFYDVDDMPNSDISMISVLNENIFVSDFNNLLKINKLSNTVELLTVDVGPASFILEFDGVYLLSTYDNGFVKVNYNGEIIEQNIQFNGLPDTGDTVFSEVLKLDENLFLLGTDRGASYGLYIGNFKDGFEQIYDKGVVVDMLELSDDTVLITTSYRGVFIYNLQSKTLNNFIPDIDNLFVECVEQLDENRFFLCLRRDQPIVFDLRLKTFSRFLPNKPELRNIRDAELDKNGLLWITTSSGLYVYDDEHDLTRISVSEGVRSKEFSIDGILNLTDTLIIPGNRGIVEIDVDKAKEFLNFKKSQKNKVFITKFDVVLDDEEDNNSLKKDLHSHTFLPHTNIITRLQFSHDNFLEMEGLAFDVRMMGLNDKWSTLEVGEYTATYTSLQPGDYEFQVRVNDPRSLAQQPVESIKITVLPPWWKTNIAYFSYLLSLVLAFYLFSWYRNKTLIRQNKKLSEKVSERTATISRLLEQKQTFFANISHEFRTPLSLIIGPLDSIAEKLKGQSDKQNISIMRRNTNRLMRLVDQILELAKFETSQSLPKQVYEVKKSMQIIAASFASLLENKQQKLILKTLDDVRLLLVEDSFEMIMTNLISNAIKYCPQGSEISVSMTVVDKSLLLVVTDNGNGIAPENLDVLFERFTRFDVAENVQGSGIGLALVKQLVLSNGGEINVVSKQGQGTEFTIKFPLNVSADTKVTRVTNIQVLDSELFNEDEKQSDVAIEGDSEGKERQIAIVSNESESQKIVQKYRLLVVEDNADLRAYIKDCLQDDYELDVAVNGQEGLKKAQNSIPDLILSDVLMPKMDGYELANAVRTDDATSHIPIVLLTAKGDDLSRMKGWEEQVDDYLTKPFKVKELKARITRLLSIRDILRKKHTSEIGNNLARKNKQVISFQTRRDKEFFVRFEKLIDKHYSDEHFSRAEAASNLALSERQLNRKLSALVDYNFSEYLRKYRLQKSAELLVSGHQVTQVAYDVGFGSPSYFSSCFKAEFGKTPRNFAEEGLDAVDFEDAKKADS